MSGAGYGALCGHVRCFLLAACLLLAGSSEPAIGQAPAAVAGETQRFIAMGNEPGWRLIIEGGRMTLNADYGATEITLPAPAPAPIAGGGVFAGAATGRPVLVTVLERICHDTMTGMPRPFTVSVEFDGRKLDGCGGEPASLLRGAWAVESIDGTPVLTDAKPTVVFGDDGSVSGHASCNSYSGACALTGEGLAVTGLLSTMKACPPPLMQQEDALLAVLRDVMRFERPPDGTLLLHTAGGRTIRAARSE
jgi:heat shock protein HslJ